jgi:hypothetical protein
MKKGLAYYLTPLIFVLFCYIGYAQDAPPNIVNFNATIDTSRRYVIYLNDGTRLKGKVKEQNKNSILFHDANIGPHMIKRNKIASMELEFGDDRWIINLKDGSKLTGRIIDKNDSTTLIETDNFGKISIDNSRITNTKEFEEAVVLNTGKIRFKNPGYDRYLLTPSAIPVRPKTGYYHNFYGLGNSVNYGITNNFSLKGGILVPMGVFLMPKLAFTVNRLVHLGVAGVYANALFPINNENLGAGAALGMITIGNFDHNFTVSGGYGFAMYNGDTYSGDLPTISISGQVRLGKKFSFVTDNWLIPFKRDVFNTGYPNNSTHHELFFSYAGRIISKKSVLTIGFVNTPALLENGWYVGIPYIDFSIHFGKGKDEDE